MQCLSSGGRSDYLQDHVFFLLRDRSSPNTVSAERHLRRALQHRPLHSPDIRLLLHLSPTTISILPHLVQTPVQIHVSRGNNCSVLLRTSQEHSTRHPTAIRDVDTSGPVHQGEDLSAGPPIHDGADMRGSFLRPVLSAVACSISREAGCGAESICRDG